MRLMIPRAVVVIVCLMSDLRGYAQGPAAEPVQPAGEGPAASQRGSRRTGRVRLEGHSLADDEGPFLGLGVSYFTALWRCKNDRLRLEADLDFLSRQGFN